jgi:hypothetical protein
MLVAQIIGTDNRDRIENAYGFDAVRSMFRLLDSSSERHRRNRLNTMNAITTVFMWSWEHENKSTFLHWLPVGLTPSQSSVFEWTNTHSGAIRFKPDMLVHRFNTSRIVIHHAYDLDDVNDYISVINNNPSILGYSNAIMEHYGDRIGDCLMLIMDELKNDTLGRQDYSVRPSFSRPSVRSSLDYAPLLSSVLPSPETFLRLGNIRRILVDFITDNKIGGHHNTDMLWNMYARMIIDPEWSYEYMSTMTTMFMGTIIGIMTNDRCSWEQRKQVLAAWVGSRERFCEPGDLVHESGIPDSVLFENAIMGDYL